MAKKTTAAGPKPRNDAYTAMLFVTFVAIVVGCALMYLETSEYGETPPPATANLTLPKLGGAAAPGGVAPAATP